MATALGFGRAILAGRGRDRFRVSSAIALLVMGTAAIPASAQAQTYDAFTSFNGTQGAGNFFYGESAAGVFTPFSRNSNCAIPSTICLEPAAFNNALVAKSTIGAFQFSSIAFPGNALVAHPSAGMASVVIAFRAPTAGSYNFSANFFTADRSPSGVSLFRFDPVQVTALGGISFASPSLSQSGAISLLGGQTFGFAVNNGGNFHNDATGFNFTVTQAGVPEPGIWAMMIMGFGLVGGAFRQHRTRKFDAALPSFA